MVVMASSRKEHNIYYIRELRAKFTRSIITHSSRLTECLFYTYGSTANFLFLGPTALIYISEEWRCNEVYVMLEILKLNEKFNSYSDFFEGQLNVNGLLY